MSLYEQPWYWGKSSKQDIADLMANRDDGSFLVRDASTPGDYTLTIRFHGQTKLVRIHVNKHTGECGFSPDTLTHSSVAKLIQFHRVMSLKIYNEQLDICLLYPVCRRRPSALSMTRGSSVSPSTSATDEFISHNGNDLHCALLRDGNCHNSPFSTAIAAAQNRKISSDGRPTVGRGPLVINPFPTHEQLRPPQTEEESSQEWRLKLDLEKIRITQSAAARGSRLYNLICEENQRASNLERSQLQAVEDLNSKLELLKDVADTQDNSNFDGEPLKEEAMKANAQIVKKYIKMLEDERSYVETQLHRLAAAKEVLKKQCELAEARCLSCNKEAMDVFTRLRQSNTIPLNLLDETADRARAMLQQIESVHVSQILGDLTLSWSPSRYLVNNNNKEAAAAVIQQARLRISSAAKELGTGNPHPQGIFLIRPSASQPNKLVLSVLHGERISHCLIEQTDQGFGFENGGLYFVTIGDFVRYYAHNSLVEHNPEINTKLCVPAIASRDSK